MMPKPIESISTVTNTNAMICRGDLGSELMPAYARCEPELHGCARYARRREYEKMGRA